MKHKLFRSPLICFFDVSALILSTALAVLKSGDYLSSEYINTLKKEKSPVIAASKTFGLQYVVVNRKQRMANLVFLGSFHSGEGGISVSDNNEIVSNSLGNNSRALTIKSEKVFSIEIKNRKLTYIWVGDKNKHIRKNTVVGRYRDKAGKSYLLHESGEAVFPGKTFKYEVVNDPVFQSFDYFYQKVGQSAGEAIGYKVTNQGLELFKVSGPIDNEIASKPYLVLERE